MKIIELEQGSAEWMKARLEMVTGTRLENATGSTAKQDTLINELIAERLTGEAKESYASLPMLKGIEAEEHAIEEYELRTGELTEVVGMCISEEFDWLANSPDRLIEKDGKYRKAVEVKCPNTDTLIRYVRSDEIPKEYLAQVQSYFLVNDDLEELDFVVYDPKIQTDQFRLWIKNVKREELPLEKTKEKLMLFYEKWQGELKRLNLNL